MKFQREIACQKLFDEILPLALLHHAELRVFADIPLAPAWATYLKMEEAGILRIFTARDEETGQLVGYSVVVLYPSIHFMGVLQSQQDAIFILKERRGFGIHFMLWCTGQLENDGVNISYVHTNVDHDFKNLLHTLGYERIEHNYARRLHPGAPPMRLVDASALDGRKVAS